MKISDRTIERLALGELPDEEAQALIQQLERDDDHRLEEIIERDAAILETYPPGVAAQHIAERVRQHQRHTKPIEKPMLLKPAFKLSTIITLFLAASLVAVGYTYVNQPKKPAEEAVAAVFEPGQDVEFYEQLIRESKAKDDNYFQSLAAAARLTSDEKTAASHRARIINEFDPTSAIDKAPLAEALFLEAEPLVTSMVGHSLHFDDEETLRNALKNKTALAKKADDQMKRVIECGVPEWSAAAHYRMGKMYVDMADAIRGSFIPDRLTAEQRVTYHGVLETQAQKTEVQAIPAFRAAMAIGIRTPYVREAELELLKLERRDARPDSEETPDAETPERARDDSTEVDPNKLKTEDRRKTLTKEEIKGPLQNASVEVKRCATQQNKNRLEGVIRMKFSIQPDGTTTEVTTASEVFEGTDVGKCIQRLVRSIRFKETNAERNIPITYPFVIRP